MKPNTVGRVTGSFPVSPFSLADATGLTTGTVILSQDGEMPVEYLCPGDRIIARDSGLVPLRGISRERRAVRGIFFAAGSLGHTRPDHNLILPESHPVLLRDWRARAMFGKEQCLVAASALVDGEFVRDLGEIELVLHRLHFDSAHVIYAGGLELGTVPLALSGLRSAA